MAVARRHGGRGDEEVTAYTSLRLVHGCMVFLWVSLLVSSPDDAGHLYYPIFFITTHPTRDSSVYHFEHVSIFI